MCVLSCAALSLAAPQPQAVLGFGDATPEEIAEIRAGTFGEMFDDNPQYNFNFKVRLNCRISIIDMDVTIAVVSRLLTRRSRPTSPSRRRGTGTP